VAVGLDTDFVFLDYVSRLVSGLAADGNNI
jgi:hypothetical protein